MGLGVAAACQEWRPRRGHLHLEAPASRSAVHRFQMGLWGQSEGGKAPGGQIKRRCLFRGPQGELPRQREARGRLPWGVGVSSWSYWGTEVGDGGQRV